MGRKLLTFQLKSEKMTFLKELQKNPVPSHFLANRSIQILSVNFFMPNSNLKKNW